MSQPFSDVRVVYGDVDELHDQTHEDDERHGLTTVDEEVRDGMMWERGKSCLCIDLLERRV